MAGVNSRFASISESEIIKIQEDSVPENTKKATKFGLKVFKGKWRSHILQTIVFQFVYWDNYGEQLLKRQQLDFTGFLLEMSRLSVFEIASCVYTKTIILFNLGE